MLRVNSLKNEVKRIEKITDNHANPILRNWVDYAKQC